MTDPPKLVLVMAPAVATTKEAVATAVSQVTDAILCKVKAEVAGRTNPESAALHNNLL